MAVAFLRRVPVFGAILVAGSLPLAGCFQSTTIVHLKADGSGTIAQRTLLSSAAVEQLRAFAQLGGGGAAADPISEAQARSFASSIGQGVTYVSSMPLKTETSQGREALYAFADISQVRISEQPQIPGGISVRAPGVGAGAAPITFALDRQPDGHLLLHIHVPPPTLPGRPSAAGTPTSSGPGAATAEQVAMARQVLSGAHLTIAVEPEGRLVRTSSPYVDGNRVVLIDVDVDEATKDPTLVTRLQSAASIEEAKAIVANAPGLKINLDPEITVEFTPAR